MRGLFLASAVALSMVSGSAAAQTSANDLVGTCQKLMEAEAHSNVEAYFDAGQCLGMMLALRRLGSAMTEDARFCVPSGVTLKQMARTVVVGVKRIPEFMHQDFVHLAVVIFHEVWPCTEPRKK